MMITVTAVLPGGLNRHPERRVLMSRILTDAAAGGLGGGLYRSVWICGLTDDLVVCRQARLP